jgi:hypothetical protein
MEITEPTTETEKTAEIPLPTAVLQRARVFLRHRLLKKTATQNLIPPTISAPAISGACKASVCALTQT